MTADDLLGVTPIKRAARPTNTRLLRRLQKIEKLGSREKRQILQFLDTFIERERLRKRAGAQ